jgi:hypothetical protein
MCGPHCHIYFTIDTFLYAEQQEQSRLCQAIQSNGFPHLRICTIGCISHLDLRLDTRVKLLALHSLRLFLKTEEEYHSVLRLCPHLRWLEVCFLPITATELPLFNQPRLSVTHLELNCYSLSSLRRILSRTPNVTTLKLEVKAGPRQLTEIASILHETLPKLISFYCHTSTGKNYRKDPYNIQVKTVKKLHELFQTVKVKHQSHSCYSRPVFEVQIWLRSLKTIRQQRPSDYRYPRYVNSVFPWDF